MADSAKENEPRTFTLRDFVSAGRERLHLDVVVGGDGLAHEVLEPMCNRPGLALTGFYGCFAWRRLQVIGQAEQAYLESLPAGEPLARVKALFDRGAYCIIFANGMQVPDGLKSAAEAAGAAVMRTDLITREFFHQSTFVLETLRAPTMRMYATTVEVAGLGVLIEGAAGLGKSETALGLVKRGNALVADDFTCIRKDVALNAIFASASEVTRNYMEIRGIGIINVPKVFGVTAVRGEKRIDLVVSLRRMGRGAPHAHDPRRGGAPDHDPRLGGARPGELDRNGRAAVQAAGERLRRREGPRRAHLRARGGLFRRITDGRASWLTKN